MSSNTVQKLTTVVNRVPEFASISNLSADNILHASKPNKISIIQCNEQWKNMKLNAKMQQQQNQKKSDCFIKEKLFRKVKFFNIEMMCYNTNTNSICQMVCQALNISENERETFWRSYSGCVKKAMKVTRNDAVAAMKLAFFKGK